MLAELLRGDGALDRDALGKQLKEVIGLLRDRAAADAQDTRRAKARRLSPGGRSSKRSRGRSLPPENPDARMWEHAGAEDELWSGTEG
eukprot:474678-Alexandrium_andersonii.AAC.1